MEKTTLSLSLNIVKERGENEDEDYVWIEDYHKHSFMFLDASLKRDW